MKKGKKKTGIRRSLTTRNVLEKRTKDVLCALPDNEALRAAIGDAEMSGFWLIYGKEKNGKTQLALRLARSLAVHYRVAYVSAEEGMDKSFRDAVIRAGLTAADKIMWDEYMPLDEVVRKHNRPRGPRVVFIDNLTMYADEATPMEMKRLFEERLPNRLIVLLAHEERGQAYPSVARMMAKMAKVIFHVSGMTAVVTSRFGGGGVVAVDAQVAAEFGAMKS